MNIELEQYRQELEQELKNILAYWMQYAVDEQEGGFYGKITHDNEVMPTAPKGAVLNSRILWTFSAACRQTENEAYRAMADRAFAYLLRYFVDQEWGGVYWSTDHTGAPLDTKKQVYAQAFALYALSEYHRCCGLPGAKDEALRLYEAIEQWSHDAVHGGYSEALARDWQPLEDVRLSAKDANEQKSMNTHLHVLEAYANLYRIWPDKALENRIRELVHLFLDRIIDPETHHLRLFFTDDWQVRSFAISYGHDIEAAWLIQEAAEAIGDKALLEAVKPRSVLLAKAAAEGLDGDGGLWYEKEGGRLVKEKHWWPQSEAMVGFFHAWQVNGDEQLLQLSWRNWVFVKEHLLHPKGEWKWGVREDYSLMPGEDKAGLWKCPYHNGRACLELMRRIAETVLHSA